MDANESYLNQHMKEVDASVRAQDWKYNYVEELLAEGGEYYPWSLENMREAIENMNDMESLSFYAYINSCRKLPDNEFIQRSAMENTVLIVERYWKDAAEKKADRDYDTLL